jgi:tetratricopeptide (TPR) repeat protein
MPSSELFSEFGRLFGSTDAVVVLDSLRQEPLIWQSLEDAVFFRAAVERAGLNAADPSFWRPSRLALFALGDPRPMEALSAEPMALLGPGLQELALQAYQNLQRSGRPPTTLRDAALLALTLRERRRLTGTWSGMLKELLPRDAATRPARAEMIWRAPLAVLYGFVPDPAEMLRSLITRNAPHTAYLWAVHAQLCQPCTEEEHAQVFTNLLQNLDVTQQLTMLRLISLHGREPLADALANRLLIGHPAFSNLRAHGSADGTDLVSLSARALSLQQMGAFYHLAGDSTQALSLYLAAQAALDQWQAGLQIQRLSVQSVYGAQPGGRTTGLLGEENFTAAAASAAGWLSEELGAVLASHPYAGSVLDHIPEEVEGAFLQIKRARRMFDREPAVARDLARQGAAGLLDHLRERGLPFHGDVVYTWRPADALQPLLQMDLPDEALALTLALVELRPVDAQLFHLAANIYDAMDRLPVAIQFARGAAALEPGNAAWRRALGGLLGKAENWEQALSEWQAVLANGQDASLADRLACANAALRSNRLDLAAELCEAVLVADANHGAALGLLGQVAIAQGKPEEAAGYLVRATLLAPDNLFPWLALAEVQRGFGEAQRSLETLRAAVTAVPDAPEAHLALAKACVEAGLLADALPHLRKAYALGFGAVETGVSSAERKSAALLFGQTLRRLGYTAEAKTVLEGTRSYWNACPELAYEYAQTLLDLDEPEAALPVLETALRGGLPVLEGHLLYARVLLGECVVSGEQWEASESASRIQQAGQALRRILEQEPDHLEARFLMADILRERGALHEALDAYNALAELPAAEAPELRWRIQWGLGQTALLLGETGTALAAVKEACQARPEDTLLQRALAEVSRKASLPHEALEAAESALQLEPGDVENLTWYAQFVALLGEGRRAVDALERAVQIDPDRPDLLVSLAAWRIASGEVPGARGALEEACAFDNPGRENLRGAARLYLRLEDAASALKCYERAVKAEADAPADLLFEVAQAYERIGESEAALELAERAVEETPDHLPLAMLQSDLLLHLQRPQAALALLERALRVAESGASVDSQIAVHDRFTRVFMREGSLPAALDHAEKALLLARNTGEAPVAQAARCAQAVELAMAMLQNDRAQRLLQEFAGEGSLSPALLLQLGRVGLTLLCQWLELPLPGTCRPNAAEWIEEGLSACPDDPRLLAVQARVMAYHGDWKSARHWMQSVQEAVGTTADSRTFWYAEAALEAERWNEAVTLFTRYVQNQEDEARAYLGLARAIVLSAEQQRAGALLLCRGNVPGQEALGEPRKVQFEEAIHTASRLANIGEVGRWHGRGQVVFAPNAQNVRAMAAMPAQPDDSAALVGALREMKNHAAAIQMARRHAHHPLVLLQFALCYLDERTPEALEAAARAVAANPNRAPAHAAMGMIARSNGAYEQALEAYENALAIWPDEPAWHDAAGDLSIQFGNVRAGLEHRQQAHQLDAENARYAFKLGQAYLANNALEDAIACLAKSVDLDAGQPDAWLSLANAYHMASRLPQALEAARQASELNPVSAEGLLIAGETALSMEHVDMALEFARDAVRREPENAAAVLFLCNALVLHGQPTEGLAVLQAATPAVKSVYPVALERARLVRELHSPTAALDILERLAREYPEEPAVLSFLAKTQAECGDRKAAERHAFKSLRLDPDQPELTLMLGRLQRQSGQLDQAVQLLGDALRMSPDNLDVYLELGSVYQERREYLQALQVYRQAMRIAPTDHQAFYQSGLILRDSKDYAGAETMLRRAAELAPDNLSIRRQLVGVITLNLVHNTQEASA